MTVHCSFCGKSQHEVASLIAGPERGTGTAYICDECVDLSVEICATARHQTRLDKHVSDVIRNGT